MTECYKKDCKSKNIKRISAFEYHDVLVCQNCEYWTYERIDTCCRKPDSMITIMHKSTGQYFIFEQCWNCGGKINKKALSAKKYGDQIRGEFSETRYDEYFENLFREKEIIIEDKEYYYNNYSRYAKYLKYLRSPEWKAKRKLALERDNHKCQKCKIKTAEQVHHLTYDNLENEKLEDLMSVCRECHEKIHNK